MCGVGLAPEIRNITDDCLVFVQNGMHRGESPTLTSLTFVSSDAFDYCFTDLSSFPFLEFRWTEGRPWRLTDINKHCLLDRILLRFGSHPFNLLSFWAREKSEESSVNVTEAHMQHSFFGNVPHEAQIFF